MKLSRLCAVLSAACLFPSLAHAGVLLCGGAEVVRAEIVPSPAGQPTLRETWHWRPEQSRNLPVPMMRKFITTDDCKPVSGGKEILITSSGDAVALVAYPSGDTLFYAVVKNAHSAELLPGGLIVVASSSDPDKHGDRLLLYDRQHSDKLLGYLPLEAAHGVIWDAKRQVLWALGGEALMRLRVDTTDAAPHFITERTVPLPAREGHDLQLAEDSSALYVTNTKTVFEVNPETMAFRPYAPFEGLSQIKSLSIEQGSHRIAYTQADPGVWWTYTLRFRNPKEQILLPSMIYKVRWF